MNSPAISKAPNTILAAKPMPTPMSICWAMIHSPASEAGCTAGIGGRLGVMATEMAMPRIRRVRCGAPAVLHSGAVAMKPRMRASGKMKAAIQASIWAEPMLIMLLADQLRNAAEQSLDIVDQVLQHPRAGQQQHHEHGHQFGNELQRGFVQLGGSLEDA